MCQNDTQLEPLQSENQVRVVAVVVSFVYLFIFVNKFTAELIFFFLHMGHMGTEKHDNCYSVKM